MREAAEEGNMSAGTSSLRQDDSVTERKEIIFQDCEFEKNLPKRTMNKLEYGPLLEKSPWSEEHLCSELHKASTIKSTLDSAKCYPYAQVIQGKTGA